MLLERCIGPHAHGGQKSLEILATLANFSTFLAEENAQRSLQKYNMMMPNWKFCSFPFRGLLEVLSKVGKGMTNPLEHWKHFTADVKVPNSVGSEHRGHWQWKNQSCENVF